MTVKLKRLALGIALAILAVGGVRTIYPNKNQDISVRSLALNSDDPAQRQVGALEFIAAWELRSRNDDFGGISALTAVNESRFVGISDAGMLIGFELTNDGPIERSFILPIPSLEGPSFNYKDRDSEGIAYDPDSGQFWVSFENKHAIRRYSKNFTRQTGLVRPPNMQDWPKNKGAEAIIRLHDGRFIVIAESIDDEIHKALLFSGDPIERRSTITPFRIRPPSGYRVTDGVQLPDGQIAIINRAIGFPQGFSAKVSLLTLGTVSRNEIISAKVIAALASPLLVDNLEGIAVTREGEDNILWLISDNNFTILQRTILMKFRLLPQADSKKPEALTAPGL